MDRKKPSPKVWSKAQFEARQRRHQRRLLAVYFATGMLLPEFTKYRLQTSSATITEKTLFVSHQSKQRS